MWSHWVLAEAWGIQFPDQGSILPLHQEHNLNHWTTKKIPVHFLFFFQKNVLFIWLNQLLVLALWDLGCVTWNFLFRCMTSLIVVRGFSCSMAYGILVPQPGIEPTSPALQSEFLTTGPPGKSLFIFLLLILTVLCKFWTQVLYQIYILQILFSQTVVCLFIL